MPPLAVLAGIGFDATLKVMPAAAMASDVGAGGAHAGVRMECRNCSSACIPIEYLFYNPLVGGLEGAARRYEMDYWVNMMPERRACVAGLSRICGRASPQRVYTVGVCGEKFSFDNYADKRLRMSPGWLEADFFIAPTQMNCDRLVDGTIVIHDPSASACRSAW